MLARLEIQRIFDDLTLGQGLQLLAVYADNPEAFAIQHYLFNTDRQFVLTERVMLASIETFRKGTLDTKDQAAEIFFALLGVLRLNPVTVFIYTNRELVQVLQRLGFALFRLDSSKPVGYVRMTNSSGIEFEHPSALVNSSASRGILQTGEYTIHSDEVVFNLVTRDIGLSWNTRAREFPSIAGVFGGGRAGVAVRNNYLWSQQRGIIACGDRGEVASQMRWLNPIFLSVDLVTPHALTAKATSGAESRYAGYYSQKSWAYVPDGAVDVLREQLRSYDPAKLVWMRPQGKTRARVVSAPSFTGKTTLIKRYSAMTGLRALDTDSLGGWPDNDDWHLIPAQRMTVLQYRRGLMEAAANSGMYDVLFCNDYDYADISVLIDQETHKKHFGDGARPDHHRVYSWEEVVDQRSAYRTWAGRWVTDIHVLPWDMKPCSLEIAMRYGEAWSAGCRTFRGPLDRIQEAMLMGLFPVEDSPDCEWVQGAVRVHRIRDYRGDWRPLYGILSGYVEEVWASQISQVRARIPGFRIIVIGERSYTLHGNVSQWQAPMLAYSRLTKDEHSVVTQIMMGNFVKDNFLSDWVRLSVLHRYASFSISNVGNDRKAWRAFMKGTQNFTFNYLHAGNVREYIRRGQGRITMRIAGDIVHTDTGSARWIDWTASPSEIIAYASKWQLRCNHYIYSDFLTLLNTDSDGNTPAGFADVCNARDSFSNCWQYFSSIAFPNAPWPDRLNTQTWWVKIPSIALRRYWREGPEDQRKMRALAMSRLSVKAFPVHNPDTGYWYGWIPSLEVAVDISGHAISMLTMSGYGVVDVRRYWETVIAITRESLKKGKKDPHYKSLVKSGNLTEDATVSPFKLWHSYWDYEAALITYILLSKGRETHLDVWTIRTTLIMLKRMAELLPETKTIKRKELDLKVRALYLAAYGVGQ